MGYEEMEKEGHKQKLRGEAELAQHRAMGSEWVSRESEMNARYQIGRQEVVGEVGRMGGFDKMRSRLHHVQTQERPLSDFMGGKLKGDWHLKTWDVKPLLAEIRNKPSLKHIDSPKEKGLMRSLSLSKEDFSFKESPRKRLFQDLNKDGALHTLHEVSSADIRDRSAPRLDMLIKPSTSDNMGSLLSEIKQGAELKHVETEDRSKPLFDKPIKLSKHNKNQLLSEIKEGAELKHVETEDKSVPTFDKDVHLKTWNRQGFLDEVRQGTELKHI
jgi:hypothetical protein